MNKRSLQCYFAALAVTLCFCLALYGFIQVGMNTRAGRDGFFNVQIDMVGLSGDTKVFGEDYSLTLEPVNQAVGFLQEHYWLIPAPVRLAMQLVEWGLHGMNG